MEVRHTPVMVAEAVAALDVTPGASYVDCTVGGGGHALAVLAAVHPAPRLLGIDLDAQAIATAEGRLMAVPGQATLAHGSFADLERLAGEYGFGQADGILFDLGLSSLQLEDARRGFSFSQAGPLDMRFDATQALSAYQLVNEASERELADIIYQLGEEPRARRYARAIVRSRPVASTTELAELIARMAGAPRHTRIHPATRTFQALRIAVNRELDNLRRGLEQAVQVLAPGGKLVVLSYHSLEDRLVKSFMRRESSDCICPPETPQCVCGHEASLEVVTRRVVRPSAQEIQRNPRSRSARLRAARRL